MFPTKELLRSMHFFFNQPRNRWTILF